MRVLVTGAGGFIGSHVCDALVARGDSVVGVDSFDPFYDEAIKRKHIEGLDAGRFTLHEIDIRDDGAMRRAFDAGTIDAVIHLAARAGVRPSIADPVGYADVNVRGTSVVLECARRAGVGRLVVASSSSVYGDAPSVPFCEDDHGIMPISPYAATKRAVEMLCHAHWHLTQTPCACLRFFTVFGPRQRPDLAINKFMRLIARGETIPMYGDGSSSRDYTYIDDIVAGVLAALGRIDAYGFRVWNLGSDTPIRLDELIEKIAGVVGRPARVERVGTQAGDVARTWADLSRVREDLGYEPSVDLVGGLERQSAWQRAMCERDS